MDITLSQERVFWFPPQVTLDQAEGRAWNSKLDAFGTVVKMTRFLQRPQDDDFELLYKEQRYQPFWHVICRSRYVYERQWRFSAKVSGPEVSSVVIAGETLEPENGSVFQDGLEHCEEEDKREVFVNAVSNKVETSLGKYLEFVAQEIAHDELDDFSPQSVIVVPPLVRASAVVRDPLIGLIKDVRADQVLEDSLVVEAVDLYYRPMYAFQYRWLSKEKEAIAEIDGLTGKLEAGSRTFQEYLGQILNPELLFDLGSETLDLNTLKR